MKKLLAPALLALLLIQTAGIPLAAAADAKKPNILFAISDDQSWPHTSAYGTTWINTPGFDRVAREGLLFSNAYTPNAKCAPSRACILTGRNTWQLETAANHMNVFPPKFTTWMEALLRSGAYTTGHTAKGWAPGTAHDAEGKPRELTGKPWNSKKAPPLTNGINPTDYAANFEDFLEAAPAGKPWAFWYGATEPHRAYEYGSGAAKGGKKTSDIDKVPGFWPDNETIRNDMLDYAFEIEHFDSHLVRILDRLEESGRLENTLVIVTADNGMPFPRVKGQEYELSNHLPLAIMWPAVITSPGRVIDDYVSFIDYAPTILEAAGLDPAAHGMQPVTGRSLFEIFTSKKSGRVIPERDHVVFGKERHDVGRPHNEGYPIRGIAADGFLYLENFETGRWPAGNPETGYLNTDGSPTKTEILEMRRSGKNSTFWDLSFGKRPSEEFFQISRDRECVNNLAANPEYASKKTDLRNRLVTILKEQEDPRIQGNGHIFDDYGFGLGFDQWEDFYEKWQAGAKTPTGWVNPTDYEKEPLD